MKLSLGKRLSLINVSNLIIFGLILFVLLNRSLTKQVEEIQTSFSELSLPLSLTLVHGLEQYHKQMEIAALADLLNMPEEEQTRYLKNILNYIDHTEFLQITDLNGRPLASTREKIVLNEGVPLEWRERAFALKFQKTLFSDITKSPFGLNFGFYTATVLKDSAGEPRAILTSFLSQSWLQSEISELEDLLKSQELPHINITLFNHHGIVLASNFNREVGAPFVRFEHYKNVSGLNQDVSLLEGLNKLSPELLPEGHELFIATSAKSEKFLESVESIKKQLSLISFIAIFLAALVSILYSRRLSRKLQGISGQVHTGSEQIGTVSGDIQKQAKALSEASEEQASALEETVASLNEINAMVEKNAENTENSKQLSSMTQNSAAVGKNAVVEMISSIADVEKSNNEMGNRMNQKSQELTEIVTMIQEIESKTKIINDIVFQTKLLSFNASVEAARAGEHGKGFAVVAQEIGALAQSSGKAAQEIETLLTSSVGKVESIVSQIKTTVSELVRMGAQNVSRSQNVASECQEKLDDILLHSTKLDLAVEEISLASREQAQGIQEISTAMEHLDQVIKKNVQISHSLEAGVKKISLQSKDFDDSSADLNELIHGTTKKKTSQVENITKKTENIKKQAPVVKNSTSHTAQQVVKTPVNTSQSNKKTVPVDQVPSSDSDQWEDI